MTQIEIMLSKTCVAYIFMCTGMEEGEREGLISISILEKKLFL